MGTLGEGVSRSTETASGERSWSRKSGVQTELLNLHPSGAKTRKLPEGGLGHAGAQGRD